MRAVVLVKFVPAPQGTPTMGPDHLLVRDAPDGALDPGDEYAIEQALRLVESQGGEVTLVSMGPPQAQAALRKGLSMGASKGILVTDAALRGADVLATEELVAQAGVESSEEEDEVERFKEFLEDISPEDFETPAGEGEGDGGADAGPGAGPEPGR